MASIFEMNILTHHDGRKRFEGPGVRVIESMSVEEAQETQNLFVLCSALELPEVAEVIKAANRAKHLRGLLVEQDHDLQWIITMLERANLRTLRNTLVHDNPQVFERVLNAWRIGAQDELIADATVQGPLLFVRSTALDTFEININDLKPLKRAAREDILEFEVAEDGSHIHWPRLDVHIDLETLRVALDPQLEMKLRSDRLKHDKLMGQAIKSLRKEAGLHQTDIEGVSARQVRRIEQGATPRSETLERFARAHGVSLNEYLNKLGGCMAPSVHP